MRDDGALLWQQKVGSPLPGEPVARLAKGEFSLKPVVELIDTPLLAGADNAAVISLLQGWVEAHIRTILEPLAALDNREGIEGAVAEIVTKVYDSMGIIPREALEESIALLTPEDRAALRARRIKLGPILVFLPALNKPAAVRLRALLWGVQNGRALPVDVPKDGIVSQKLDEQSIDRDFYQSIGYPVYGGRAIRIDMLDRVISAVYDAAQHGKFQAQHKMAEWLGSSIEDLYAVLEAMGHKKVYDPADAQEAASVDGGASEADVNRVDAVPASDAPEAEVVETVISSESTSAEATSAEVIAGAEEGEKPAEQKKPELATFRLKRGKANEKEKPFVKKPYHQKADSGEKSGADFKKKKEFGNKDGGKDRYKDKEKDKSKGKRERRGNPKGKEYKQTMMVAEAKHKDDSPFAILEQLKKQADGS